MGVVALWELSDEEDVIHSQPLCHITATHSLCYLWTGNEINRGTLWQGKGVLLLWVTFFTNPRRPVTERGITLCRDMWAV